MPLASSMVHTIEGLKLGVASTTLESLRIDGLENGCRVIVILPAERLLNQGSSSDRLQSGSRPLARRALPASR
jgi:hypothetical protein